MPPTELFALVLCRLEHYVHNHEAVPGLAWLLTHINQAVQSAPEYVLQTLLNKFDPLVVHTPSVCLRLCLMLLLVRCLCFGACVVFPRVLKNAAHQIRSTCGSQPLGMLAHALGVVGCACDYACTCVLVLSFFLFFLPVHTILIFPH